MASDPYYQSPRWAEIRKARLRYDSFRCSDCGEDGTNSRLEVHHLTYDRFGGNERLEDLQTLCNFCHMRLHGRAPLALPIAGASLAELAKEARHRRIAQQLAKSNALASLSLGAMASRYDVDLALLLPYESEPVVAKDVAEIRKQLIRLGGMADSPGVHRDLRYRRRDARRIIDQRISRALKKLAAQATSA